MVPVDICGNKIPEIRMEFYNAQTCQKRVKAQSGSRWPTGLVRAPVPVPVANSSGGTDLARIPATCLELRSPNDRIPSAAESTLRVQAKLSFTRLGLDQEASKVAIWAGKSGMDEPDVGEIPGMLQSWLYSLCVSLPSYWE